MNCIFLSGYLGADPQAGTTAGGKKFCRFRIGVRYNKEKSDWFNCVAYDGTAESIEKFFKKGSGIEIRGRVSTRKWSPGPDEKSHTYWDVIVGQFEFPKKNGSAVSDVDTVDMNSFPPVSDEEALPGGFGGPVDDDDIPF